MGIDTGKPFRRRDAVAGGVAAWRLATPAYRKLFHGVYVDSAVVVTPALRAKAALLVAPAASHVSHQTAAEIWGGWVPNDSDTHISCPGRRPDHAGIAGHRSASAAHVVKRFGLRISSPAQTFLDLAGVIPLVELVVLGDSLVKAQRVTAQILVDAAKAWRGHGARVARQAAALVREGVRSPMESRLRMLLILVGLPEPVIDHKVYDAQGHVIMRYDLSYPPHRLILEYDGRQHAESDEQWDRDIERREDIDQRQWRIVVIRSKDIYQTPRNTLLRIVRAMVDQKMPVPSRWRHDWSRHFPSLPNDAAPASWPPHRVRAPKSQ
jgi:hypothetical protein